MGPPPDGLRGVKSPSGEHRAAYKRHEDLHLPREVISVGSIGTLSPQPQTEKQFSLETLWTTWLVRAVFLTGCGFTKGRPSPWPWAVAALRLFQANQCPSCSDSVHPSSRGAGQVSSGRCVARDPRSHRGSPTCLLPWSHSDRAASLRLDLSVPGAVPAAGGRPPPRPPAAGGRPPPRVPKRWADGEAARGSRAS